jgi:lauroyl/myristoyl acyltransferase
VIRVSTRERRALDTQSDGRREERPAEDARRRALSALEVPHAHPLVVVDESWISRIYTSRRLRRLLPVPLTIAFAWLAGHLLWCLCPQRRRAALEWASHFLDTGRGSHTATRLARRMMIERIVQSQLVWRPDHARWMQIDGLEHLEEARAGGSGVICTGAHMGTPFSILHVLAPRVQRLYVVGVGTTRMWKHTDPETTQLRGRHGRAAAMMWQAAEDVGCRWVPTGPSYRVLRAFLARGDACWINFDVLGRTETRIGNRRFMLASGVSALGMDTGVKVVPAFPLRNGLRLRTLVLPPIDPAEFDDQASLQRHITGVIDGVVSAHPEQMFERWPPVVPAG